ncbi:hypothetical protein, partial [Klebsiella pneumoniae]|uniref:hypothetical protein n=1 Tax=Klebsiella pneumoniae TaxID=573 RepID=UPI003B5B72EC
LIKASLARLSICPEIISNLKEIRAAREDISVIVNSLPTEQHQWVVNSLPTEQHQWANDVTSRINRSIDANVSVCILDTGVNYNNPLL